MGNEFAAQIQRCCAALLCIRSWNIFPENSPAQSNHGSPYLSTMSQQFCRRLQKKCLLVFQIDRNTFQIIKYRLFKNATFSIFRMGLTYDFCQTINIFFLCFSAKKTQIKLFANVIDRQKSFPGYKIVDFKKTLFWGFSRRGKPVIFVKISNYYVFFVSRRKAFQAIKISTFKK